MKEIALNIEVAYYRADSMILNFGDEIHDLYLIRSGAVEIYRRKGELYNRIDEGDLFGQMGLLMNNKVRMPARAIEDTLVYCIPEEIFNKLCDEFDTFADFVELEDSARLRNVVSTQAEENDLTTSKVRTLLSRDPVTISRDESIQTAAMTMAEENISAMLIVEPNEDSDDDDYDPLVGIITDRDLCSRVIAKGLDTSTPVSEVMSTELISLDYNAYVFEAMLTMLRYNVHHLPVLRNKNPIGIIGLTDIVRYESQNSLLLVSTIFQQQSVEELQVVSEEVKHCFVRMVNEDANAHMIGSALSVIGRSFKQRLAELAHRRTRASPYPILPYGDGLYGEG